MKNSKNTAGKFLLVGATVIGVSAAAVSIRAKAVDRDRQGRVDTFRAADEELSAFKVKRAMARRYLVNLVVLAAGAVMVWFDVWAGWTLTGLGAACTGVTWTAETGFRARYAWIPLGLGTLVFIGSFIMLCVTRADFFLAFTQSLFT